MIFSNDFSCEWNINMSSSINVKQQQTDFYKALMNPLLPIVQTVQTHGGLCLEKRFAIYRNNVFVGMMDNLSSIYILTQKILKTEQFSFLLKAFIRKHPPRHPIMLLYGEEFPDFLAQQEGMHPFIVNIAYMEWCVRQSQHARDATPISVHDLQNYSVQQQLNMRFQLHPSVHIISSAWNLFAYSDYTEFPDDFIHTLPEGTSKTYTIVITRPQLAVSVLSLAEDEGAFLKALTKNLTFGQAYEKIAADYPEFNLVNTLSLLVTKGVFSQVIIEE